MDVIHRKHSKQFTMSIGEEVAFVNYVIRDNKMFLTHAQVPYNLRGKTHVGNDSTFRYRERGS